MENKWRVTSNYIPGRGKMYAAYRIIDTNATDHSGNREYGSDFTIDKAEAIAAAEKLNAVGLKTY